MARTPVDDSPHASWLRIEALISKARTQVIMMDPPSDESLRDDWVSCFKQLTDAHIVVLRFLSPEGAK